MERKMTALVRAVAAPLVLAALSQTASAATNSEGFTYAVGTTEYVREEGAMNGHITIAPGELTVYAKARGLASTDPWMRVWILGKSYALARYRVSSTLSGTERGIHAEGALVGRTLEVFDDPYSLDVSGSPVPDSLKKLPGNDKSLTVGGVAVKLSGAMTFSGYWKYAGAIVSTPTQVRVNGRPTLHANVSLAFSVTATAAGTVAGLGTSNVGPIDAYLTGNAWAQVTSPTGSLDGSIKNWRRFLEIVAKKDGTWRKATLFDVAAQEKAFHVSVP